VVVSDPRVTDRLWTSHWRRKAAGADGLARYRLYPLEISALSTVGLLAAQIAAKAGVEPALRPAPAIEGKRSAGAAPSRSSELAREDIDLDRANGEL
jgi:hypothetical protein